jgi:peptidoglycan/xylan/chitin deacetylase (PgdA/CDA1 family)
VRCVALEYHDVVGERAFDASGFVGPAADSYKLTTADFDAHLDALGDVAPEERGRVAGGRDDRDGLLFTFDDAGASALGEIAPRLEARGWRGHFFAPTDWIGRPGFVDWAGLRELHVRGHVVGTHSASHPLRLGALPPERILREWRESRDRLEQALGAPVEVGSLPGGLFRPRVAEAAAAAGLRVVFTSDPTLRVRRYGGCDVVGRFTLRRGAAASEARALALGTGSARLRQAATWNTKAALKRVGGPLYLALRRTLWGD